MNDRILPPLKPEEYARLKADIAAHGVLEPVVVDNTGDIIDGYHRLQICRELKITNYQTVVVTGLSDAEKVSETLSRNISRRQLNRGALLKTAVRVYTTTSLSMRAVAEQFTIHPMVLSRELHRAGVTKVTPEETPRTVIGRDGKKYPAQAVKRTAIQAKGPQEAQKIQQVLKSIDPSALPNGSIDAKRLERIARDADAERRREEAKKLPAVIQTNGASEILIGDFRQVLADIADGSVDLVFTDPPYPSGFLPLWEDLAAFGARVLKPGGYLLAYTGVYHLPTVMSSMCRHLEYHWSIAMLQSGPACAVHQRQVNAHYKQLVVFLKPPCAKHEWIADVYNGMGPEKDTHPWQQAENEADHFIELFSKPGDLVVDPFLGSGTTAAAAKTLGRRFVGCDIDPAAVAAAIERLN
jgi:hypothetical protein